MHTCAYCLLDQALKAEQAGADLADPNAEPIQARDADTTLGGTWLCVHHLRQVAGPAPAREQAQETPA